MTNTDDFFKCSLFLEDRPLTNNFSFNQKEILYQGEKHNKSSFAVIDVEYKCRLKLSEQFDATLPTIIIPSRNGIKLLEFTLNNLMHHSIQKICNIMIVDDRSTDEYSLILDDKKDISYLRCDNQKGFNFSMLCNIAAYVAYKNNCKEVILWNNDLWVEKREYLETIIAKHREDKSTISGTKLLYPLKSFNGNVEDSHNIKQHFPDMKDGKWRGTVQFGGASWAHFPGTPLNLSPMHYKRFSQSNNALVNCDKGETFVTGALQLIELEWFIKNGGLNPSLSKNFQDVDLCLRANENGDNVMYYGKDIFFWHDESLTFNTGNEKKNDAQMISDHFLFAKIWNDKIGKIVL
jgi:GT2 family glycosyltransferase